MRDDSVSTTKCSNINLRFGLALPISGSDLIDKSLTATLLVQAIHQRLTSGALHLKEPFLILFVSLGRRAYVLQLLRKSHSRRRQLCPYCGKRIATVAGRRKLMRSRTDRKIAGVCAGFAEYFDLDVTVVRVVWLIVAFFGGGGVLAYVIAWIVVPEEPAYVADAAPASPPQPYQGS